MKRVYICSPLNGDVAGNIERAKEYCREAAQSGALPLAAHVYFTQLLDDSIPAQRETGMQMGLELLKLCDEVWVYGDVISSGMAKSAGQTSEIALAKDLELPIIYMEGMKCNEEMDMAGRTVDCDMPEYDGVCSGIGQQLQG